jgi:Mrp family chromosome partitioning ATPase
MSDSGSTKNSPQINSTIKKKYVVLSGKGGVGKSTVAVNIATGLALNGFTVGLLDSDLHGPSVAKMLNLVQSKVTGSDEAMNPIELYNGKLKVMSVQFLLANANDSVIWRGPLKHKIIKEFIENTVWGNLDFLIVDSPPGTGDEPLSVIQTINNTDGAIIVTTPQSVSTFDVEKSINFCKQLNLPIFGIIENMAGFVCPQCNKVTHIFGKDGGRKMAEKLGIPFLGSIPIDPLFVNYGDEGKPFAEFESENNSFKYLNEIINEIKKGS